MSLQDLSTRKLFRQYTQALRNIHRYRPHRREGIARNSGISGLYWEAHLRARKSQEELRRRGYDIP